MRKFYDVITVIRSNEWWEYKLPPILAAGYMVIINSDFSIISLSADLVILLFSLITGAAYVSILNDATDTAEDALAGKKNKMAGFTNLKKICLASIPVFIGAGLTLYFSSNRLTMWLYIICYCCFTVYSLPPVRLKKRGIIGIVADAAGSQLFPTLFVVAFLLFKTQQPVNYYHVFCIGAWSSCFGLRGILWHQFHDRENDLRSGIKTVVHKLNKKSIFITGIILISIELLAFFMLLLTFRLMLPALMVLFYFLYVFGIYKRWKVSMVMIKPATGPYRIFMNEYYQVLLPISLIASVVPDQPSALIVLLFHIALFPLNTVRIFRECCRLLTNKVWAVRYEV